MSAFLLPAAVFLAVVFAMSAIGKLRAPDRGRAAFDALRIPVARPEAASTALILLEALVAVSLVVTTGWLFVAAAGAALLLTTGLLIVVIRAYRLGATDDCGCFGEWLPAAIGPRLIFRNAVLAALAFLLFTPALLFLAITGRSTGVPLLLGSGSAANGSFGALAAAILIALGVWSIARATSAAPVPSASIARGTGAVLVPATSEIVDILAPGARARLVLFVSAGCHACATALDTLIHAQDAVGSLVEIYVVQRASSGPTTTAPTHALPSAAHFALDIGGSLGGALELGAARPVAALIGTDGAQAGPLARGSDEIAQLIDSIVAVTDEATA
ncbi:MauE/DoxX family redox-associated membrane protein [Microbacterium sp. NPDC087591]|uniref:MauE/DoxX family redox-associated membrane protein n=1 Tax=Microbacterium sp. NPDC087591 TaxID=3364192 RepID=UPI0038099FDA